MKYAAETNPDDFIEAIWVVPEESLALNNQGAYAKDDLPILIRRFYAMGKQAFSAQTGYTAHSDDRI